VNNSSLCRQDVGASHRTNLYLRTPPLIIISSSPNPRTSAAPEPNQITGAFEHG
jgi:hypothetical protein